MHEEEEEEEDAIVHFQYLIPQLHVTPLAASPAPIL
jgi:hypothetical protein